MRVSLIALLATVAVFGLTATAMADELGPPSGTIYAFDQAYRTVAIPTALPNEGAFDTTYVFPDCASCASVSEAAPGSGDYHGGRWKVVAAYGITTQLTNAGDVGAGVVARGHGHALCLPADPGLSRRGRCSFTGLRPRRQPCPPSRQRGRHH